MSYSPNLDFDGQYYAQVADNTIHEITTQDFSISAWVKIDVNATSATRILVKRTPGGNYEGYELRVHAHTNGALAFYTDSGIGSLGIFGSTDLRDGKWHHVAILADRDNVSGCKVYIDGADRTGSAAITAGSLTNTAILTLGATSSGSGELEGSILDVKIYIGGLWTPAQILYQYEHLRNYSANAGILTDYWRCDEGAETTVSGNVNDLTLTDVAAWHLDSSVYQGAWQSSYYQGAWQQQAQELSHQTNESVAVADAVSVSIKSSSAENIAVADSLTVVIKHAEPESVAVQDAQAASIKHTEAESIGVADMSIAGQHIILSEQIEVADSISVDIIHSESEQVEVSDSLSVKIIASQSENIAVSDQLTVVIRHEESENIGVADAVSTGNELATSEHIAVSDALSVVLKHTEAEDVAVSDSQSGTLESAIKDPTDAAVAFTGTLSSGRKHPRHGVKQVGIHADPILAVTTSSSATTFTKTSVTDATAWDLSRVEAGYILVTGDGYSGIVQSTQGNTVNVNSWVRSGIDRRGLAEDKPDDGLACTVHIAAEAQMISVRANSSNTGSMYLAFASDVDTENGHPIVKSGTGSEVTIRSVHGQKLDLTRIWVVSPVSQKADWLLDGYSVEGKLLWGGTGEGITIKHTVSENIAVSDALSVIHTEPKIIKHTVDENIAVSDALSVVHTAGDLPSSLYFSDVAFKSASAYVFAVAVRYDTFEWGIVAIDVSDPSVPVVVGWLTIDPDIYGYAYHCQVLETEDSEKFLIVSVSEYSGVSGGLLSINITNPASMSVVDKYDMGDPTLYNTGVRAFDLEPGSSTKYAYIAATDSHFGLVRVQIGDAGDFGSVIDYNPGVGVLDVAVSENRVVIISENRLRWLDKNLTLLIQSGFELAYGVRGKRVWSEEWGWACVSCYYAQDKPTGFSDSTHKLTRVCIDGLVAYVSVRSLGETGSTLWAAAADGSVRGIGPIDYGTTSDDAMLESFNNGVMVSANVTVRRWYSCDPYFLLDGCHTGYYLGVNCVHPNPEVPPYPPLYMLYPKSRASETHDVLRTEGGFVSGNPYLFIACADEGLRVWSMSNMWSPVLVSHSLGM